MDSEIKDLLGAATLSSNTRSTASSGSTLKNEDFRQLLSRKQTQTSGSSNLGAESQKKSTTHTFSHRQTLDMKKTPNTGSKSAKKQKERNTEEDENDIFGPSNLNEILKNYRDRAEERRKGAGKEETMDDIQANSAYRAVPGDVRATADAAQRRKQAIQESKYLGGDMEHTHLVKGLDYSLLHKVRSEISIREQKNDEALETHFSKDNLDDLRSDNRMVKNMHRTLFHCENPLKNELFRKGRMAYVIDLEEENDLPTTLLRSVHDCPVTESTQDINTSNMLIQKLTQVLSYLRTDMQKKKKKGEGMFGEENTKPTSQSIFDDERDGSHRRDDRERMRDRDNRDRRHSKPASYFEDDAHEKERSRNRERGRDYDRSKDRSRRPREDQGRIEAEKRKEEAVKLAENVAEKKKKMRTETEGYAECYPGGMYEAAGESDDEADYSKMDMGNRRGPVKRWDFEDHADYEKYMESKEAMPKAAYQFGVKTNDGRRTRKSAPERDKHKLDREFSQITKILEKRKADGHRSEGAKKIKY